MNYAVCTLCIGEEATQFAQYSHPTFRAYAQKIGADFIVFDTAKVCYKDCKSINTVKFEKYQLYEILERYDRALFLDSDILITPHAKNIFPLVPAEKVGGVFEDFGSDKQDRRNIIQECQNQLGKVNWRAGYMNSGVFVVSKIHRDIFRMIFQYGVYDCKYEQTNTNWYIHKAGFKIHKLNYKWNYMGIMRVYYGLDPRKAYFIHYAGGGIFSGTSRHEQIKQDYEFFYGKGRETSNE